MRGSDRCPCCGLVGHEEYPGPPAVYLCENTDCRIAQFLAY